MNDERRSVIATTITPALALPDFRDSEWITGLVRVNPVVVNIR